MKNLFEAILPGWKGQTHLPAAFPWHIRLVIAASLIIVQIAALFSHARTFGMLKPQQRVALLEKLYVHPWPVVRNMVQWWKLLALMMQC
jgi:hypothetical protein